MEKENIFLAEERKKEKEKEENKGKEGKCIFAEKKINKEQKEESI